MRTVVLTLTTHRVMHVVYTIGETAATSLFISPGDTHDFVDMSPETATRMIAYGLGCGWTILADSEVRHDD